MIIKKEFDWKLVKNLCRATSGKEFTDKEPTREFDLKILIAEHSPIYILRITFKFAQIKSWVATHFVRHHVGVVPFVSTQREDRTGISRDDLPQSSPVDEYMEANAQALINMSKVRLCYQASRETRWQMEALRDEIEETEPEMALVMVPSCVYRGGCPEMTGCTRFEAFTHDCGVFTDITERYKAWREWDTSGRRSKA